MKKFLSPFEEYFLFQLDKVIKDRDMGRMVDSNQQKQPIHPLVKYINDTTYQAYLGTYVVYLEDCIDTIKFWMEHDRSTDKYTLVVHHTIQAFDDSRLHSTKYHMDDFHKKGYLHLWRLLTDYRYEGLRNVSLMNRANNLTPNLTHPVTHSKERP